MNSPRELSPIPELLLEYDDCEQSEVSIDRTPGSLEDEGYASESQRLGVDQMLNGLAEMSRRLSLAPSEVISIDEALHMPSPLSTSGPAPSRFDRDDIAGGLESFWTTVRSEMAKLRKECNEAHADSAILAEEVTCKAKEVVERDATIAKLKSDLSAERKAGKQLQEAMEDLLAWVDTNRSIMEKATQRSSTPPLPVISESQRRVHRLLERVDSIPTYGVAFRKRLSNEVILWSVQVVEAYDRNGMPVYYHGSQLPKTLKSYIKFLQFWSCDLPPAGSGALCLWCIERGFKSSWHKGFEGLRPCRECAVRGRHCFSIVSGVVRCLPIKNISGFLKSGT